ncbi:hypothetical protein LJC49_05890 [Ruminococcaceae bacterium OttesenSCG-928-I18]|nr:hypothetical protein [Ruminococcaceae bacterium OttesenSCG-928-I18]
MREIARRMISWICLLAMLSVACLCGCTQETAADSSSHVSPIPESMGESMGDGAEILIRQDVDELAAVRIEDGQASIRLDLSRWEELYGAEFIEVGQMFGDLEVIDFSDPAFFAPIDRVDDVPIKDACIGAVPNFSDWSMYSFPVPVAMLLREDGRVEAVFADPFATRYTSEGMLLAYIEDVESLYVDISSGDGRGDPSIYAVCADGLRYDLQYLFSHTVSEVFGIEWSCVLADSPLEAVPLTVQLQLFEDSTAQLTIFDGGGLKAKYEGNHEFVLAEDQEYRPPTLVLDLALGECYSPAMQARGDIKGSYFYELGVQDLFLHLWLSFGDSLYVDEGGDSITEYWLSGYGEHPEDYDAASVADFRYLQDGDWVTELEAADGYFEGYQAILRFEDENHVDFLVTLGGYEVIDAYTGSFSIIDDSGSPSGYLMVFDLALDWTSAEGGGADDGAYPRREIKGTYIAEMTNHPELYLWLSDGDGLYNNQFNDLNGPKTEYTFAFLPYAVG